MNNKEHLLKKLIKKPLTRVSREVAAKKGLTFYWEGLPCKEGHIDLHYTSNGECKSCMQEEQRKKTSIANSRVLAETIVDSVRLERLLDEDKYLDDYYKEVG